MPFAQKFSLALKALSISRVQMAADLGVDKSLVGRWAAGSVHPSEHNLSRITQHIASRIPVFTMLDWNRDATAFAGLFGVESGAEGNVEQTLSASLPFPPPFLAQCRAETIRRGKAYEGFWRTTRPSILMTNTTFHDYGMIRVAANGLLEVRMGGSGLRFDGWMLPAEGNVFVVLYDSTGFTPLFLIFRGVTLPKAVVLDGLLMLAALDASRTPAALPLLLERIGDLSGDASADDAACAALIARDHLAEGGDADEETLQHLFRNVGPQAAKSGGSMFLVTSERLNHSKGTTVTGDLSG